MIEVNFEKTKFKSVESDGVRLEKKITKNAVLFFNEIQEAPIVLKMLRYFYKEMPQLAIIAAGSLLELAFKAEDFSFPVGPFRPNDLSRIFMGKRP